VAVTRLAIAVGALAACGGKRQPVDRDAAAAVADGDAARAIDAAPPGGGLTVRVEWKDAPAAVRASPGRDACGDPRDPYVRVHTLHGVADVVVWVDDLAPARDRAPAAARVAVRGCRLDPPVQALGGADGELLLTLAREARADAELRWTDELGDGSPAVVIAHAALPVAGHTVSVALDRPWLVEVRSDAAVDPAFVVVPPHRHVAVTDASGAATLDGIPPGDHTVKAWLRGVAGEPARVASGTVAVPDGGDAQLTLSIAP
jgi:hypothetical protein